METFKKSEIFVPAEAVSYADGAIVSKVIFKQQGGNITLFAFDREQGLSEHTAPFDALLLVTEGEAEIVIDKKSYLLETGKAIVMPAHIPHAVHARKKFKMILTMIKD